MEFLSVLWNELLLKPMTNGLVMLYFLLFHNFGLALLAFTVATRLVTLPLTLRQVRQTRAMSQLQPKIKALQARYAKDRQKLSQETFKLYREEGVSPIGCLGPLVVQMPIFIALYWALIRIIPTSPENVVDLSHLLYPWLDMVHQVVPLNSHLFGLDLAQRVSESGGIGYLLPLLVGGSMWVQQKMMTYPNSDAKQQQTSQIMLWMLPLMFIFFTFQFPSGLALYWIISNVVGIAIQFKVTGWGGLRPKPKPLVVEQMALEPDQTVQELEDDGRQYNDHREDSRRGYRNRPTRPRRRPKRGRN